MQKIEIRIIEVAALNFFHIVQLRTVGEKVNETETFTKKTFLKIKKLNEIINLFTGIFLPGW